MSPLKLLKAISPPFLYNVAKVIKLKFFNPNKNSFSGPYKSSSEVTYDGLWTSNHWLKFSKTKLENCVRNKATERHSPHLLIPLINDITKNQICEVLDWGGGTGHIYFNIQNFLCFSNSFLFFFIRRRLSLFFILVFVCSSSVYLILL